MAIITKRAPAPNRIAGFCAACLTFLLALPLHAFTPPEQHKYNIISSRLENGMDVIVIENHGLSLVTIEIVVKNGSYTEPPDYNGLSHLYEHMFFKGNQVIPNQERYMERLRELGAQWNGTTGEERVNYYMTIDKKNLREGAQFIRNALRYPLFKEEELRREWPVVLGEFDRNEAEPGFHLQREIDRLLWYKYYSRKNPIGDRDVIFNATREQMKTIQQRYYIPNNSALIVAGDVNPSEVFDLAEELFGDWKPGEDPHIKYPEPEHPPIENTGRIAVIAPVKTITIDISWQGPSVGKDTAATYAADVLSYILSQADSQFQKNLVDTGLVDGVGLTYSTQVRTGPISLLATTSADRLDKAWAAIEEQIKLLDDPAYITDEQIESAKNMIEINEIYSRERSTEFANSIASWWATAGLNYYLDYIDNLRKVTRDDLYRYIQTYIKGQKRIEGALMSAEDSGKVEFTKTGQIIRPASGSSKVAFEKSPGKATQKEVTTEEFDVAGLKVVLRENTANEIVVAQMMLIGGLQFYGPANAGRELTILETLDKGSKKFSKAEVNQQFARTGATLGAEARPDYSIFSLTTLLRDLDKNFPMFADAITSPLLADDEAKLSITRRLQSIKSQEQMPDLYLPILASKNFYKGFSYEAPPSGTEAALSGITPEDLRKIHHDTFIRSRMKLFIVGNINKETATRLVTEGFKDLPQGAYERKVLLRKEDLPSSLLVEKRELPTNYIFGAYNAPNLSAPDFYAAQVALSILDDRLFEEIRTKRNLTYAVSASISSRLSNYGALYVTAVAPEKTLPIMFDEIDRIGREPVTEKELKDKIEEMITSNLMKKQTNASQAASLILYDAVGPGWQAEAQSIEKIRSVTAEQIQEFAKKYLKNISFAILGNPEQVDEKLFTSH